MGDRKGSPLLYHESARQACGEACASPGWCGQSLSAYGRRKRPHPTQLFPRPYGFEGSSEGMSYHTYPCKSTTAPTRKRGFFLLNLTPFGRNDEFSQNNWDTGRSPEGRSIGNLQDQWAPTGVWFTTSVNTAPPQLLDN